MPFCVRRGDDGVAPKASELRMESTRVAILALWEGVDPDVVDGRKHSISSDKRRGVEGALRRARRVQRVGFFHRSKPLYSGEV